MNIWRCTMYAFTWITQFWLISAQSAAFIFILNITYAPVHHPHKNSLKHKNDDEIPSKKTFVNCVSKKKQEKKRNKNAFFFFDVDYAWRGEVICRFASKRMRLELNDKMNSILFFFLLVLLCRSYYIAWTGLRCRCRHHVHISTSAC